MLFFSLFLIDERKHAQIYKYIHAVSAEQAYT